MSVKKCIMIAFMSAIIAVLSPLSIVTPISIVPISLGSFAVYLTLYILGAKYGVVSIFIFILLGMVGVPVFTGFTGGIGKILGPTGGYIIGYIFLAIIAGSIIERNYDDMHKCFLGIALGTIVLYIIGTVWLSFISHMDFKTSLFAGVIPFIPGDIIKMIIACILGKKIRSILTKAGYL